MAFFNSAIGVLQTLVIALGAGLAVWGGVNLMEGYGQDNPGAKSQGMKQLMAGGGIILTFVCCWELIQMIMEHNNMANFEISLIFKWIMKTFVAVVIVSNTFNITMAVFDVAHHVIASSGRTTPKTQRLLRNGRVVVDGFATLTDRNVPQALIFC